MFRQSKRLRKYTASTPSGSCSSGMSYLHIVSVLQLTSVSTSLGLASYIYSLDGTTTYFYLPYATSEFDKHSLISTIQVAQAVVGTSFDISQEGSFIYLTHSFCRKTGYREALGHYIPWHCICCRP